MINHNLEKMVNIIKEPRVFLSILWLFATLNYIYADVFSLFFMPGAQNETFNMASGTVLVFAFLMETAIAMVLLSRVLGYGVNRWLNVLAAVLHTGLVAWSLSDGEAQPYYIMFASIEMLCTLFILVYALRWRRQTA